MSRNQVIVQFPLTGQWDLETLLEIEQALVGVFAQRHPFAVVDGHDIGQERFNIYIIPKGSWRPAIDRVHALLTHRRALDAAKIVKQLKGSGKFVVVWPEQFSGAFEI
ncbi:hypothetical protein ACQ859_25155 [Roseateles chitinivorans]|uniref:hypothetical protein n=1 Tax=Roseateles chitinivorans TaxID=2917965 RepID=UPI003D66A40E